MRRPAEIQLLNFTKKKVKKDRQEEIVISEDEKTEKTQEQFIGFEQAKDNEKVDQKKMTPWMTKKTREIKDSLLRFHNEIIEFTEYICPNKAEHQKKQSALEDLRMLIIEAVGECKVEAFGSFQTKLYLPDGDIDVAVLVETGDTRKVYEDIYLAVMSKRDVYKDIEYIRKSKVPLIKCMRKDGEIQFDISVNKEDGLNQLAEVKKIIDTFPEFKYMAMVLKCMLKLRSLGETYSGGLGSFLLFCMVYFYLRQTHRKNKYYTLSEHLLRFMQYYAINNDWVKKRIMVASGEIQERWQQDHYFSVMSPQDTTHDIGKSAFKIRDVFGVFRNRFRIIVGKNFKKGESVLKQLINPSETVFAYLK